MFQNNFNMMLVKLLPFERRVPKSCLQFIIITEILLEIISTKFSLIKTRKFLSLETVA